MPISFPAASGTGSARPRSAARLSKAERHSQLVAFLRKALPVFAVLVLATYFISRGCSVSIGDMNASIGGFEVTDGNLRMINPKLKGADKKNGQYVIGADYADQDIKNPNMIKLHAIKADLAAIDGGWSRMEAVRGIFNSKTGRLVMQDKINIATSSGVSGELKHATLDTKNQILRSHRPVSFVLPNGTVRANALTFHSAKHTLTFRGKVAVHMVRPKKEAKPAKARAAAQGAAAAASRKSRPRSRCYQPMPERTARSQAAQARPERPMPASSQSLRALPGRCAQRGCSLRRLRRASGDAQTLTNAFGGLSQSSNEPIDIESDVLVVHDKEKYATFKGNVKAVQGTTTLRAKELNVHYVGGGRLAPGAKKRRRRGRLRPRPRSPTPRRRPQRAARTPRSPRSRRRATSSSPATRTRPRPAIGPFTTWRGRW